MQKIKVDTIDLKAGMFVAQLDRPWLETPFLFQGFEVREDSEVDLLRDYCRHVYVDVTRSSMAAEEIERLLNSSDKQARITFDSPKPKAAPRPTLKYRILRWLSNFDPTGRIADWLEGVSRYRIKTSLKEETASATAAYDTALHAVNDVLDRVREGRTVDVDQVRESVSPMIESVLRNPGAMTWLVLLKKRDSYTYNHSIASSVWASVLGRHLGFDRPTLDTLALGALLLDIGKARLPQELLHREGELSDSETELLRLHVDIGLKIAKDSSGVGSEVLDMIASHHERLDGSGYPRGLKGADIPVYGRIAGLIDCYDAMTSQRSHVEAMSSYEAVRELNALAGLHFQKELVEQFVQALGMFPAGSIVELNSGEVGIVIEQNRVRRLRPKVMIVLDPDKQPVNAHTTIDLRKVSGDARKEDGQWITTGHEPGAFGIDPAHYFIG